MADSRVAQHAVLLPLAVAPGDASVLSSVANLCNTIIGAGILGLPYAVARCGLPVGIGLLGSCALGCCVSLHLLALSAKTAGVFPSSFYAVANAAIPNWTFVIDLAVAVKCFGVATSYLIVTADMMPPVMIHLGAPPIWHSRELWVTLAIGVAGPLACSSKLDVMKYTSALSILCVCYLAGLALAMLAEPSLACSRADTAGGCRGELREWPDAGSIKVLSIFIFGFTCQQNIFSVVNELHTPRMTRINGVILMSVAMALALYATVALSGYFTYGSKVKADVLLSYPSDSAAVTAARIAIAVVVVFSYPLQAHPSRKCSLTLVRSAQEGISTWRESQKSPLTEPLSRAPSSSHPEEEAEPLEGRHRKRSSEGALSDGAESANAESRASVSWEFVDAEEEIPTAAPATEPTAATASTVTAAAAAAATTTVTAAVAESGHGESTTVYWAYTAFFILASFAIALVVDNLGTVMALVGATGSTAVSYILPGAIYYVLHPWPHAKRYVAAAMFLIGVCIVPISLTAILRGGGD
mmetsp:Transcript_36662/g.90902  ORF Transcript_36662/g.90902 Transcript_36662/m.90902 type:complete len:527 (+) Transcript_36662:22-1602(+)